MLENLKIDGNNNRIKVLEYLEKRNMNLSKYKIEDFSDYPGGIQLIDEKNRKIVIYYDFLFGKINVVYRKYRKKEKDLKDNLERLWDDYSEHAAHIKETARFIRDVDGNVTYYRYRINENGEKERTHTSRMFNEQNELYDIYEYMNLEMENMFQQKLKILMKMRMEKDKEKKEN